MKEQFVVVGAGVAGVCCAEEVCRLQRDASVTLITPDGALKASTTNTVVIYITRRTLELTMSFRVLDLHCLLAQVCLTARSDVCYSLASSLACSQILESA